MALLTAQDVCPVPVDFFEGAPAVGVVRRPGREVEVGNARAGFSGFESGS